MPEYIYIAWGSVRGWCSHRHRTPESAAECAKEDHHACSTQGGYSDRAVWELTPQELSDLAYSTNPFMGGKMALCEACAASEPPTSLRLGVGRSENPEYSGYWLCQECIEEYDNRT